MDPGNLDSWILQTHWTLNNDLITSVYLFFSGVYFQGTTIGMAPIMSMCTADQSGGIVMVRPRAAESSAPARLLWWNLILSVSHCHCLTNALLPFAKWLASRPVSSSVCPIDHKCICIECDHRPLWSPCCLRSNLCHWRLCEYKYTHH